MTRVLHQCVGTFCYLATIPPSAEKYTKGVLFPVTVFYFFSFFCVFRSMFGIIVMLENSSPA